MRGTWYGMSRRRMWPRVVAREILFGLNSMDSAINWDNGITRCCCRTLFRIQNFNSKQPIYTSNTIINNTINTSINTIKRPLDDAANACSNVNRFDHPPCIPHKAQRPSPTKQGNIYRAIRKSHTKRKVQEPKTHLRPRTWSTTPTLDKENYGERTY